MVLSCFAPAGWCIWRTSRSLTFHALEGIHCWYSLWILDLVRAPTGHNLILREYNLTWWQTIFLIQGLFVFKAIRNNQVKNLKDKKGVRPQDACFPTIICKLFVNAHHLSFQHLLLIGLRMAKWSILCIQSIKNIHCSN